jgi:hypothetical protein
VLTLRGPYAIEPQLRSSLFSRLRVLDRAGSGKIKAVNATKRQAKVDFALLNLKDSVLDAFIKEFQILTVSFGGYGSGLKDLSF